MTNKEIVLDVLRQMPEDASLYEIAQRLEFIATLRRGISDLDDSGIISIERVEQELPSWSLTTVRKRRRRKPRER
jgi:hypothetical protein